MSPHIWATFVREFIDKNSQKPPNLVTLQPVTTFPHYN